MMRIFKNLAVGLAIIAMMTTVMTAQTKPANDESRANEEDEFAAQAIQTRMPGEEEPHEGTWLQWAHHYTYGRAYRNSLDAMFVELTRTLAQSENVHIVTYNYEETKRVTKLLRNAGVSLAKVDFVMRRTDDVWVRDNGPIFVYDNNNELKIADWGFNGWGFDTPYRNDDSVPVGVANNLEMPRIDLNDIVLEGGAIEIDGNGVLLATRSSTMENGRNEHLTQAEFENALTANLGVTKFIWLDGKYGGEDDITDTHIDGFARFAQGNKIVTMGSASLRYWGLSNSDINRLYNATNINGAPYSFVQLPLTARNVVTTSGENLGFKGSYVNYYVANTVVLMPVYNDPNDIIAKNLLQNIYPNRTVVGIDVRNLYKNGGMVHCITQQQPAETNLTAGENN